MAILDELVEVFRHPWGGGILGSLGDILGALGSVLVALGGVLGGFWNNLRGFLELKRALESDLRRVCLE